MRKRYILIAIFIIFIIATTVVGSLVVTGSKSVIVEKDILDIQTNKEVYFTPYGYTIDNPNIIINPYGNSPLTALIMFETNGYSEVGIRIKGKNNDDITYTFKKDKYHLLPIYGLYPDYDNTVVLTSEGKNKSVNIKTNELPQDFEYGDVSLNNYVFNNTNYPYIVDSNGEVRWYLNSNYYGEISFLDNSNIIIGSDKYDANGNSISFYEMNLLGKIYNEYIIPNGYYGKSTSLNGEAIILSDKIMRIDLQTGEVKYNYIKNDNFESISVNEDKVIVKKDNVFYEIKDNKLIDTSVVEDDSLISFYNNTSNYNIVKPNRFGKLSETKPSDKHISLVKYDKKDNLNINIKKEVNRTVITNNNKEKNIYIILDKFLDKRIYELKDTLYINDTGLNGKYTIYYKIKDKTYKTNYFIEVNNG